MDKLRFSIVTINGETHRRHRQLMQPAFHPRALDGYASDIVEVARVLLDRWPVGEVTAVDELCEELALAMAMKCLYGLDVSDEAAELGHLAASWVRVITAPSTIMLPLNVPGFSYRRSLDLAEQVTGRLRALIAEKRARGGEQRDAMALLMRAEADGEAPLSDDELVAEAVSLFIAGHETIAMTLTWTLFLLERHPDVHDAVMDELDGVLGGRVPTPADIGQLTLLDRVLKESMRVLAPVPVLFLRVCGEDAVLGPYDLPVGANVLTSPIATHRDPALYPDPDRFLPDRWLDLVRPPYAYLPYGGGPRTCLGMLFAERALRLLVPMILQRFRLSIPSGTRVDRLTRANILRPRGGPPMRVEPAASRPRALVPVTGTIQDLVAC